MSADADEEARQPETKTSPVPSAHAMEDRTLFSLAWPVGLTVAVSVVVSWTDLIFLGASQQGSDAAIAGTTVVATLWVLCSTGLRAFASGCSRRASHSFGAGDDARARTILQLTTAMTVLVSLGLSALLMGTKTIVLVRLIGIEDSSLAAAESYYDVLIPSLALVGVREAVFTCLLVRGRNRNSVVAAAIGAVSNIVLNLVFLSLWPSHDRVSTIATATILALAVTAAFAVVLSERDWRVLSTRWPPPSAALKQCPTLLRYGVPEFAEAVLANGFAIVLGALTAREGTDSLTARAVALQVGALAIIWSVAVSQSTSVLAGYRYGQGDLLRVRNLLSRGARICMVGALLVSLAGLGIGVLFAHLAIDSQAARHLVLVLLLIELVVEPMRGLVILSTPVLSTLGRPQQVVLVGMSLTWLGALPLALVLSGHVGLGVVGVWLALAADESVRGAVNFAWCRSRIRHLSLLRSSLTA